MSTTDNSPMEDRSSADLLAVTELQCQLNDLLKQLSPELLKVLTDFAAYGETFTLAFKSPSQNGIALASLRTLSEKQATLLASRRERHCELV